MAMSFTRWHFAVQIQGWTSLSHKVACINYSLVLFIKIWKYMCSVSIAFCLCYDDKMQLLSDECNLDPTNTQSFIRSVGNMGSGCSFNQILIFKIKIMPGLPADATFISSCLSKSYFCRVFIHQVTIHKSCMWRSVCRFNGFNGFIGGVTITTYNCHHLCPSLLKAFFCNIITATCYFVSYRLKRNQHGSVKWPT